MAINDISQYYTLENGTQIANDNTFASLAANSKVKNKNTGSTFVKNSNYSNVFDRYNTFNEFVKAADFKITNSGSGNGVSKITWTPSSRTITQYLTNFATPSDLSTATSNLNSRAVGSISVSGTTVTYKNLNGQTLGSFQTQDNNTTYSAGRGLSLVGSEIGHSLDHASDGYASYVYDLSLHGKTLVLEHTKVTYDRYGHMKTASPHVISADLSNITATIGNDPFAVGSTIIIGAGYDENLNYGNIISGGAYRGWCPDDGGGALSGVIHIPGTWICVCGSGNNSNVRGGIIRRIA